MNNPLTVSRHFLVSAVAALLLAWGVPFNALAAKPVTTGDESARVDALFAELAVGVRPGAAVMVIRDGAIIHARGYGYANLEEQTPITPDSAFRLASVSKQFAAMAIAMLADQGKLDYEDPVSKYVPELAPYEGVTIRHLLTHTSGLPDYYDEFDPSPWLERDESPSNADMMVFLGGMNRTLFAPGEKYEYSNPAYEVLPVIVEAVTGVDFATFMKTRLFQPIGMKDSLIHDHHWPEIPRRVLGYTKSGDGYEIDDYSPLNGLTGSGGQYSTLKDFYHWDQALYGEALVSAGTLQQVFTRARLSNGEEIDYGFGWRLDSYRGHRRIAHGGSWVGFRTAIARYPDIKFSIVILTNLAEYEPGEMADKIADIYLGEPTG